MTHRHAHILDIASSVLVIVDLQEAFRPAIFEFERIVARTAIAVQGAALLGVPILVTEQYPQRLGATAAEIRSVLPAGVEAIAKTAFSSCGAGAFTKQLSALGRKQIVLAGIETHVCVNQTAHDLLTGGFQVHLLTDCISSRTPGDREAGFAKMRLSGAVPSSSEMALFELMRDAKHERFKAIQKLVK
jgi:nicotinamidase-related amidase